MQGLSYLFLYLRSPSGLNDLITYFVRLLCPCQSWWPSGKRLSRSHSSSSAFWPSCEHCPGRGEGWAGQGAGGCSLEPAPPGVGQGQQGADGKGGCVELAVLRVPLGNGLSSVWRQGWRYLLCSGRSVGSNDVFHLSPLLPLNKEWGMGESATQLHPVLARVKQLGLFFSQREVLQEEDSQTGRGRPDATTIPG